MRSRRQKRSRFSLVAFLWDYAWRFKLTRLGKWLIGGGFLCGLLSSASLDVPVYPVFCGMFLVGFVSLLVNLFYRPRLSVSGTLPERVVAGEDRLFHSTQLRPRWQARQQVHCQLPTSSLHFFNRNGLRHDVTAN